MYINSQIYEIGFSSANGSYWLDKFRLISVLILDCVSDGDAVVGVCYPARHTPVGCRNGLFVVNTAVPTLYCISIIVFFYAC